MGFMVPPSGVAPTTPGTDPKTLPMWFDAAPAVQTGFEIATPGTSSTSGPTSKGAPFKIAKGWGKFGGWATDDGLAPVFAENPFGPGVFFPAPWPAVLMQGSNLRKQEVCSVPGFLGLIAPYYGEPISTTVGAGFNALATQVFDLGPGTSSGVVDFAYHGGVDTLCRVWSRFTPVAPGKLSDPTTTTTVKTFTGLVLGTPAAAAALAAFAAASGGPVPLPPFSSLSVPTTTTVPGKLPVFPTDPTPVPALPGPAGHSVIYRIGSSGLAVKQAQFGYFSDYGSFDDSKPDLIAGWSARVGGFVCTGSNHDKHLTGITEKSERVMPAHLSVYSVFCNPRAVTTPFLEFPDGKHDAGLDFDLDTPWAPVTFGPYYTYVFLRYDPDDFHALGVSAPADDPFFAGEKKYKGRWKWQATGYTRTSGGDGATSAPGNGAGGGSGGIWDQQPRREASRNLNLTYADTAIEHAFSALLGKPQLYAPLVRDQRNAQTLTPLEVWRRDQFHPVVYRIDALGDQTQDAWTYKQRPGASRNRSGTAAGLEVFLPPEYGIEKLIRGIKLSDLPAGSTSASGRCYYGTTVSFGRPLARQGAIASGFRFTQPSVSQFQIDHYGEPTGDVFYGTPASADTVIPYFVDTTVAVATATKLMGRFAITLDTGASDGNVPTKHGSSYTWDAPGGSGSFAFTAFSTKSANFTAVGQNVYWCGTNNFNATLPAASSLTVGTPIGFFETSANTTTFLATGGDTLLGVTTINGTGKAATWITDGVSSWTRLMCC